MAEHLNNKLFFLGKYDLSPQNSTCFIHKLSNLLDFIKLTSFSADAFTDPKSRVYFCTIKHPAKIAF